MRSVDLESRDVAGRPSKAQVGTGRRRSGPHARIVAIGIVRSEAVQIAKAVVARCAVSARRRAAGIQMEMLVGEQEQDRSALLLDPAGRRSLINPFRSGRECRMFVDPVARQSSAETSASTRPLAASVQAPDARVWRRGGLRRTGGSAPLVAESRADATAFRLGSLRRQASAAAVSSLANWRCQPSNARARAFVAMRDSVRGGRRC
jgi:hypothetical protein